MLIRTLLQQLLVRRRKPFDKVPRPNQRLLRNQIIVSPAWELHHSRKQLPTRKTIRADLILQSNRKKQRRLKEARNAVENQKLNP